MEFEPKELKRRRVSQEQNIEHQSNSCLTDMKYHSGDSEPLLQECATGTSDDNKVDSLEAVDSLSPDKDIQKEVERIKRRRSTIGRGHASSYSLGGRQSLCASSIFLSLEDQISKIDKGLPWTSKVSSLFDISIRETLRRLEASLPGNELVTELRADLLTKHENLCGKIAYKVADCPNILGAALPDASHLEEVRARSTKIAACKKRTKELEEEYKKWKILMRERKIACQAAEREFHEAKSREKKIDVDDQINGLTLAQRNFISSTPNYQHYIQESKMAHEKAVLMFQEERLAANRVSSLVTGYEVFGKACYAAVEELSFGPLRKRSTKAILSLMLQGSDADNANAAEA